MNLKNVVRYHAPDPKFDVCTCDVVAAYNVANVSERVRFSLGTPGLCDVVAAYLTSTQGDRVRFSIQALNVAGSSTWQDTWL